jgi:predicted dehydrogenase
VALVRLLQPVGPPRSRAGGAAGRLGEVAGALPKIDFNERHFWHWRCYWPYGTGQAGDLLSHELDHVQTVLGWGIPDTCISTGLNTYYHDDREVPDTWAAAYKFEKRNCLLTFEGSMNSKREQPPEYIGRDGRLIFNSIGQSANRFWIYPDGPAFPHMQRKPLEPTYVYDLAKAPKWPSHMDDFLAVRAHRRHPKCNIDEAFIEIATVLMSTESYRLKREVRWDRNARRSSRRLSNRRERSALSDHRP